jgi:hypothetical protein
MQLEQIRKKHGDMEIVLSDSASEYQISEFGATWKTKECDVNQMEGRAQIRFKGGKAVIGYSRDGTANQNAPYHIKFAAFIEALAKAKKDGSEVMVIAEPWVIGDSQEDLVESLSRLAGTHIGLEIIHRKRLAVNNQN